MNHIEIGDCNHFMEGWIRSGVQVQTCITSPPYFGLRDYGVEGQLGNEQTPQEYVERIVSTFEKVRQLLKPDGTLWLNLGDSYAGGGGGNYSTSEKMLSHNQHLTNVRNRKAWLSHAGLKPKDLIGIPWRVALALQEAGWYLRQDIIWNKPNAMPESVTDRCVKAHEYIFLLSKSPQYKFNHLDIREEAVGQTPHDLTGQARRKAPGQTQQKGNRGKEGLDGKRNKRSVWNVNTKPYHGAHFATFPRELITPCVLAGSDKGDVVFDPFMGSGTTAEAALLLGRKYLGCELDARCVPLQTERLGNLSVLLGVDSQKL